MKSAWLAGFAVTCASAALAQGVAPEWDVRTMLDSLQAQQQRLKPMLDQIRPDSWVAKGAPQAYVAQWNGVETQLKYLLQNSEALSKQPEKLTLALDTYFRMQSVNVMLASLMQGIRKYQGPATADIFQAFYNANAGNRDKLRDYVRQLAQNKEAEFQVIDREAQRCRGALLKEPTATTHVGKRSQ